FGAAADLVVDGLGGVGRHPVAGGRDHRLCSGRVVREVNRNAHRVPGLRPGSPPQVASRGLVAPIGTSRLPVGGYNRRSVPTPRSHMSPVFRSAVAAGLMVLSSTAPAPADE